MLTCEEILQKRHIAIQLVNKPFYMMIKVNIKTTPHDEQCIVYLVSERYNLVIKS